jgi:pimeloyl-ACP methyl ester carboxylesterase
MLATMLAVTAAAILGLILLTVLAERRIARYFAPDGQFIDVDGTRIHYVERGQGRPLVLVHGLSGQTRHFSHSLLAQLEQQFRVILIDRPGAGHSMALPGGDVRIRAQADLVARFIRKLGLKRPLLVGHSLGGAVALAVALDHPDTIAGLALIAPLTHNVTEPPAPFRALALRSRSLRWLLSRTLLVPAAMATSKATLAVVFGPEPVPHDFPTAGGGLLSLRPAAYMTASADMQAVADDLPAMEQRYADLRVPVGILYGTEDGILDCRVHGQAMRDKVAGLRLHTVQGGHMLPLTQPATTGDFIRAMAQAAP